MTMAMPRIGALRTAQTKDTAALLRVSFSSELHPYLPYCQPDAAEYLRVVVSTPAAYNEYALYAATNGRGDVVGMAEFRGLGEGNTLLSYLCVAPAARGTGLAEALLRHHLRAAPAINAVELDVFAHNAGAARLYDRLGFRDIAIRQWVRRAVPCAARPTTTKEFTLTDWHASYAAMERYGFCRISGEYAGRPFRLGLTSPTVIRVETVGEYDDDELLARVRSVAPDAGTAFLVSDGDTLPSSAPFLEVRRLRAHAAAILSADR